MFTLLNYAAFIWFFEIQLSSSEKPRYKILDTRCGRDQFFGYIELSYVTLDFKSDFSGWWKTKKAPLLM